MGGRLSTEPARRAEATRGEHGIIALTGRMLDPNSIVEGRVDTDRIGLWRSFYGDIIPGQVLADRVASFVHVFNLYWYAR